MCNDIDQQGNNVTPFPKLPPQADVCRAAIEKIEQELETFQGGTHEKYVSPFIAETLKSFCQEDARFAAVVYQMKRTLSDCCASVMKGAGNRISDIEVYRKATQFYFPNAEIEFKMNVTICGDAPTAEELEKASVPVSKPRKQHIPANALKPEISAKPAQKPAPAPIVKTKPKKKEPDIMQLSLF